ncbi:hypothetical protein H7K45_04490 [Mycobacterium yunnanensis]|uniref:Uncharacterized protein n=1 Tax=Mycobacterium yunnanensis TaxID=368477 RepID=A0A9X2YZU1_9MYCO|nr:hypothetical protein [Mycobacterium yunnanensis]MCV7419792.1 hypothetical protein [Mycobacterium yunnanensis]
MSKFSVWILFAVTISVVVSACHSTPAPPPPTSGPAPQPADWPENLTDFRFRWSADPGFALDTGWAVPLRAYVESLRVIFYTRDPDAGYPGLERVTPESPAKFSSEWKKLALPQRDLRGTGGRVDVENPRNRFAGNEELYVLKAEPIASGFRAFVCDSTFGVYKGTNGSQFSPWGLESVTQGFDPDFTNMAVWRIEFSDQDPRAAVPAPLSPQTAQRGPEPAPRGDVFGPWFVIGAAEVGAWYDVDAPSPPVIEEARAAETAMRDQCLAKYPLTTEQRKKISTTPIATLPEVKPAAPGWPSAPK